MSTYTRQSNPFLCRRPYVYAIMWTKLNTAYVGVRSAKGCHPDELWKRYFTSSEYVTEFRKLHGEPDHIEIIERFLTASEATRAEHDIISTFALHYSPVFLNKACALQVAMSDEVRLRRNAKLKGRKRSPEVCAAISNSQKGRPGLVGEANGFFGKKHTPETLEKMREGRKKRVNRPHTEEAKRKISEAMLANPNSGNRKGNKASDEARENMRLAWIKRRETMVPVAKKPRVKKERKRTNLGEHNNKAVLNEVAVIDIRSSGEAAKSAAARYGVHVQTIHDIRSRRSWRHLP